MSREDHDRLSTADLVAGTQRQDAPVPQHVEHQEHQDHRLPPQQQQLQQPQHGERVDATHRQPMQQDADAAMREPPPRPMQQGSELHEDQLVALFPPEMAADFRNRWDQVQIGFVDDPRRAVSQADELVAQVMKNLASSFAEQRTRLEAGLGQGEQVNTENLRMALRGYRSFFQRLLSL